MSSDVDDVSVVNVTNAIKETIRRCESPAMREEVLNGVVVETGASRERVEEQYEALRRRGEIYSFPVDDGGEEVMEVRVT